MARKKISMRPQAPQVKPSAAGTGQVAPQPQVSQQPAQPQTVRPQAQPGQTQAAQTIKSQAQPVQQSQPIQK